MLHDIIPDIHGDVLRLDATLAVLGWTRRGGRWQGPEGRRLVFLGDFIDGGPDDAAVLRRLRELTEETGALAVMGNHELNAIHFHRRDADGIWMRAPTEKNTQQHQNFVAAFGHGTPEAVEATERFLEMPLWLDLGDLRVVHACWDDAALDLIAARRPDGRLQAEDLAEVALDESDFARAVNQTLKGPKRPLPGGARFTDHAGHRRSQARVRWWAAGARSWRDAVISVPDLEEVPDIPVSGSGVPRYDAAAKPVIFGHYKLAPGTHAGSNNTLCLDYPQEAVAFRQPEVTLGDLRAGIVVPGARERSYAEGMRRLEERSPHAGGLSEAQRAAIERDDPCDLGSP